MLKSLFFTLMGVKPLVIRAIHKDCVELSTAYSYLYGAKVISNVERVKTPPPESMKKLASVKGKGRVLFLAILKDLDPDTGYFLHEVYYFSYSKELLKLLEQIFGKSISMLSGLELANSLQRLQSAKIQLQIDQYKGIPIYGSKYYTEEDLSLSLLRSIAYEREIDEEEYKVFVGTAWQGFPTSIERLFETSWQGTLWLSFDLENADLILKMKERNKGTDRPTLSEARKKALRGEEDYFGINAVFITRDQERVQEKAVEVFFSLGFSPVEKRYAKDLYVRATPLLFRDYDYYFVAPIENLAEYLIYSYEKTTIPSFVEVWGRNRHGSFVAYNVFEENPAPHVLVLAPTGAGKSFGLQNIFSQILRVDVEGLLTGELKKRPREDLRLRWFDKGFSAEIFFKLMKERGIEVGLFSATLDEISYNPCEIEEREEDEYEFAVEMVSSCLESLSAEGLSGEEKLWFIKLLKEASINDAYKSILSKTIYSLRQIPSLYGVYEELLRMGYQEDTRIGEVKGYDFLKHPLLEDVYRLVQTKKEDPSLAKADRNTLERLYSKLHLLLDLPEINAPTQIPISDTRIVYLDYEFLSESKLFIPLLLAIFKRLIKEDKFKRKDHKKERAYYVIDEAHNLFARESFARALRVLIKEARKWGISVWLATQDYIDIPKEIYTNMQTKLLIAPQEESQRREYFKGLSNYLDLDYENSDLAYVYFSQPAYTFTVWYSGGVFSLSLPVDNAKKLIFDSTRFSLETPDGKKIVKSAIKERK